LRIALSASDASSGVTSERFFSSSSGYGGPPSITSSPSNINSPTLSGGVGQGSQVAESHAYSVTTALAFFFTVRSKRLA
jgi:hypothetical protein